jgi:hypothetical protein
MNDDPEIATYLRIEERELEAGGLNLATEEGFNLLDSGSWTPRDWSTCAST